MAEDDGEHSFDESKLEIPVHKGHVKVKPEYTDNNVILSVNHLKVFFPMGKMGHKFYLKAVHNTNFQIHKGEVFGLVGESGCGKSTTGRSIIRLEQITSGSIYYKGVRIAAGDRWNRKEINGPRLKEKLRLKKSKLILVSAKLKRMSKSLRLRNLLQTLRFSKKLELDKFITITLMSINA